MPPHGDQPNVRRCDQRRVGEKVAQSFGEMFVRQQAPAGRSGEAGDAVAIGELHLDGPRPSADVEQPLPVDDAFFLGPGRWKMFCRQGAKDVAREAGVPLNDPQRVAALRHGALAEHLSRNDERGAQFRHHCLCLREHEYLAIDAGIHISAVAVLGIPDEINIFLAHVDDAQFDADGLGHRGSRRRFFFTKALRNSGREVQADHLESLVHDDPRRQHAVEAA